MFWSDEGSMVEKMRTAESKLLEFARRYSQRDTSLYTVQAFDTPIPRSNIPLKESGVFSCEPQVDELIIHAVKVSSPSAPSKVPLVFQHGYMNGGMYFYRNIFGLSQYFSTIYTVDMLGWGLSSRPAFNLKDDSVETTEEFYVESLEAWRRANKIDKMVLVGHSMGGYFSVAYCEKYPQHVERLILASPVGVPLENPQFSAFYENATLSQRFLLGLYERMFYQGTTPGSVLRSFPKNRARFYVEAYVTKRLKFITLKDEQDVMVDYLLYNGLLPGSGEYLLNKVLRPAVVAKKPLLHRIPSLQIPHVSFLYGGTNDWMGQSGGLDTQLACEQATGSSPRVEVYSVRDCGHLLMLENWQEFNAGVALSCGLSPPEPPTKLCPRRDVGVGMKMWHKETVGKETPRRIKVTSAG